MVRSLVSWVQNIFSRGAKAPSLEAHVKRLSRTWRVSYKEAWRVVKRHSFLQDIWMHEAATRLQDLSYQEALRKIGER